MNGWKYPNSVCETCQKTDDPTSKTIHRCRMITHTTHSAPLKNSQHMNGCHNGHQLTNSHYHQNIDVINNHKNMESLNYEEKKPLDILSQNNKNLETLNHNNKNIDAINLDPNKMYFKMGFEPCSLCPIKPTTNGKNHNHSDSEDEVEEEEEDDKEDHSCGIWSFRPRWLQQFANKKAFLAVFCLTSVLQGMYYTYFVSVLTTIEKLFQIQSKWTGIIMSATEMGQIFGALLLTYYGGQGHRPKWIACGMLVFAIAAVLCATPHFLFQDITAPARIASKSRANSTAASLRELRTKLCFVEFPAKHGFLSTHEPLLTTPTSTYFSHNVSALPTLSLEESESFSQNQVNSEHNIHSELSVISLENTTLSLHQGPRSDAFTDHNAKCELMNKTGLQDKITEWVLGIFFVSLLFIGIGATAVYTLGIPYIDDNVATKESPLYFGITIGVRIFGPVFGFLLGSYCTSLYVNFPFEYTDMTRDDPQWIGAWWVGVFFVGGALILTTIPMMAFPKKLPKPPHTLGHSRRRLNRNKSSSPTNGNSTTLCGSNQCHSNSLSDCQSLRSTTKKPTLKDFPAAIRRLTSNDILLLRTASSVLHILPIAGLYTFLPKYLESQFQLTATMANMIAGIAGILVMGVGIFASGTYMRRNKPNARFVAGWIALAALAYAIGMVILMWLGCPLNKYVGLNAGSGAELATEHKNCNSTCGCKIGEFAPICTTQAVTYLSPCLAGCTEVTSSAKDHFIYKDCHCLEPNVTAVNGFCPLQCSNLVWYILIFSVFVLIHSTSEVGSMLLTLRCVDPQDKAMALGLISFAIGLFGNVPCPIIYGAVVDSACLFWEDNCGEPGACRLYDPSKFRMVFHGVTAVIMFAAFVVDAVVWYKAKAIQFSTDEHEEEEALASSEEVLPFSASQNNTSNFESSV